MSISGLNNTHALISLFQYLFLRAPQPFHIHLSSLTTNPFLKSLSIINSHHLVAPTPSTYLFLKLDDPYNTFFSLHQELSCTLVRKHKWAETFFLPYFLTQQKNECVLEHTIPPMDIVPFEESTILIVFLYEKCDNYMTL
jgi:hypothetical protein